MTILAAIMAGGPPRALATRTQPKTKPSLVLEQQVKRAAAVKFQARRFDRAAAARCSVPYRVEFLLLDGGKAVVAFAKPELDEKSVSWRGPIEGNKYGSGVIVLYDGVVSGSLRFDNGRVFDLVTSGRDVWMREIDTAVLDREEKREVKP